MLNECEQLWASRAAQALDARLTNHVVALSTCKPRFTGKIKLEGAFLYLLKKYNLGVFNGTHRVN